MDEWLKARTGLKTAYKIESVYLNDFIVFKIPTERGDVYMKLDIESNYAVVEVDAQRFLDLWRSSPHSLYYNLIYSPPDTWADNDEVHKAENGFARGEKNPVPLADVSCIVYKEKIPIYKRWYQLLKKQDACFTRHIPYTFFTDGIARTLWLITFGAKYFPVMCDDQSAGLLHELAGLPGGRPKPIKELLQAGWSAGHAIGLDAEKQCA